MDSAVVVLSRNIEGTKEAAGYMRRILQEIEAPAILIVAPGEGWEDVQEITETLYGRSCAVFLSENEALGVNAAITFAVEKGGSDLVHVFRSDVMVSPVWRSAAANSRMLFAAVGPCGPQFSGSQFLKLPEGVATEGFTACASFLAGQYAGKYGAGDHLDAECFAIKREAWEEFGEFEDFGDLQWSLRDWCLRVRDAGKQVAVIPSCYATVMDRNRLHPWDSDDVTPRLRYYAKHAERTEQAHRLTALLVVQPGSLHQLDMLRRSLGSIDSRVDAVCVVMVDHPSGFREGVGPVLRGREGGLFDKACEAPDEPTGIGLLGALLKRSVPNTELQMVFVPPGWNSLSQLEARVTQIVRESGSTWCLRMIEGDLLEPGITTSFLRGLMEHPDPMVTAYNVGIYHLWEADTIVREDRPYGDGGDLTGAGRGINDWRLYRTNGSRFATDGGRIANLRFQQVGIQREEFRRIGVENTTGMRCSSWSDQNRIGLHLLSHGGENGEDVARWLDWTHGLSDRTVVVWTGGGPLSGSIQSSVFKYFGVDVRFGEKEKHFARWRNLALLALGEREPEGEDHGEGIIPVDWGWFIDPDEWVTHPVHDLMSIRRMAEQGNRFGYLQEFANYRAGGTTNTTAAVRMARLGLGLTFDGRVHETFGESLAPPQEQYGADGIARSPFTAFNRATIDPEASVEKLELYRVLIREELQENPKSARHWILLSYQYAIDGFPGEARECLDQAVLCSSPTAYLGFYERAMLSARQCKADLTEAVRRLPEGHHHHAGASHLLDSLQGVADAMPSAPGEEPAPLPKFPEI
jgi:hypothetical protein